MPVTIWNLDNAWLTGEARYNRWERKFDKQFNKPTEEAVLQLAGRMLIEQQPQQVKQQLEALAPTAYTQVMKRGGNHGNLRR